MKPEIDVAFFTGTPLFVLILLQHYRTQRSQQATNMKELLAEFRKEDTLYLAYFELVYTFDNDTFDLVKDRAFKRIEELKHLERGKDIKEITKHATPDFSFLNDLQGTRLTPGRLFWPSFFAFSPEERRLDQLLDYFNAVGFYEDEGLIRMHDIAKILGDYLAVLNDRLIVKEYLEFCRREWEYDKTIGAAEPFAYLPILLGEFGKYNAKAGAKREVQRLKMRIEEVKMTKRQ